MSEIKTKLCQFFGNIKSSISSKVANKIATRKLRKKNKVKKLVSDQIFDNFIGLRKFKYLFIV